MSKLKSLIEIAIVLILSFSLWEIISTIKFFKQNPSGLQAVIIAIWIFIPALVIAFHARNFKNYGITFQGWSKSLKEAIIMAVFSLPLFIAAYGLFQMSMYSKTFTIDFPDRFLLKGFSILLFICLPEEFFFRGYLQTEFNKIFGRKYCLFNVKFGPGLFIAAFLFVIVHIWISKNWLGLAGLFPAVLFGWLREKTEGIIAPIIFHGFCDITYIALE